jgi:hypothetical protein
MSKVTDNQKNFLVAACRKMFKGPDVERIALQFADYVAAYFPEDDYWEPIETAPREGRIIVCNCEYDTLLPLQVEWDEERKGWLKGGSERMPEKFELYENPTHWIRVPLDAPSFKPNK